MLIRIEPDWNVKEAYIRLTKRNDMIRIEPDWNVKWHKFSQFLQMIELE